MGIRSNIRLACLVAAGSLCQPASAQYWEEAGAPTPVPGPYVVYSDTVHDWLLVAGQTPIVYVDTSYMPLLRYNGLQWDTLGLFNSLVRTAVVYHDSLFVGGSFDFMRSGNIAHVACYADGAWHPYGTFGDQLGNATIQKLRVVDGELYAAGIIEQADGQPAHGLAKRVGGHWEPLPGWAEIPLSADPWLHDIIRYQGKLVVAGSFHTPGPEFTLMNMAQYDGGEWLPVCDYCLDGGMEGLSTLAEYQGSLYVGGVFYYFTGNAGQGVMRWDGENWYSLGPQGDGIQVINYSDQYSPGIRQLLVHDSLLYIGGGFSFVDHVESPVGICAWDGTEFCLLQGEPFSTYYAPFTFYHDTLYGGTDGSVVDPAMRGVIRYLGELCTYTVEVEELGPGTGGLQLTPLPGGSQWAVQFPGPGHWQLELRDALGRHVRNVYSTTERVVLDLGDQASGLYLLRAVQAGAAPYSAKLLRP
jgi:hypothetical protein